MCFGGVGNVYLKLVSVDSRQSKDLQRSSKKPKDSIMWFQP